MKTKIIHLEPYDDVISIKDKMAWGNTERILLVYPGQSGLLNRKLDLLLLLRHSLVLGVQIALVSKNHDVVYHASQLGIPLFSTINQAQNGNWRTRKKKKHWKTFPKFSTRHSAKILRDKQAEKRAVLKDWVPSTLIRLIGFTLGVAAILSLVVVLIPSASITITPQQQTYSLAIEVQAIPELQSIKLNTASLPIQLISVEVNGTMSAASTGSIDSPSQVANGEVTFTNLTSDPIKIPKGLIVRTPGDQSVRFVVTQSTEIAAGQGNSITMPVSAIMPGVTGNLPPDSLTALENPIGLKVSVTNQEPTSGGTTSISPLPTRDDREKLYQTLKQSLEESALDIAVNQLNPGDILLSENPISISVEEQTYSPEPSTPSDYIELSLHLKFGFQIVKIDDMQTLTRAIIQPNLPIGSLVAINEPVIENITLPVILDNNTYRWQIQINQEVYPLIDSEQVINQSVARTVDQASQWMIDNLPLEKPPEISIFPAWWLQMPILPIRISLFVHIPG